MDRSALHRISYGVYIVATGGSGVRNGQIANTVFQVTSEPATIAISINKQNYTHECLEKTGLFSVSVLTEEAPMVFIGRFGFRTGRDLDKLEGLALRTGAAGCPVVTDHSSAFVECRIASRLDCGTHTLFLGELTDAGILDDKPVMTYAYYHLVKKGKSPSRAPTYIGA